MNERKVLIIEDHQESRENLATVLKRARFDVLQAASLQSAFALARDRQIAAIVTELKLPDGDGLNLLKKNGLDCPVLFVTAFGTMSSAIQAMKLGAVDFLTKPVAAKELTEAVNGAVRQYDQQHGRDYLEGWSGQAGQPQNVIIGVSRGMRDLFSLVERIAPYGGNVLIYGESGAGKEVIAREIHRLSPRRDKPFVPVNCASVPDELLENELFGHERGAFTGANEKKFGVFETANEGTLFLDEINEMGLRSQAKLLRALERKEFRRLGGTKKVKANLRLISATNVNLEDEIRARRFREDLYYRIKVITLVVPPLRDRKDDLPYLVKAFMAELERSSGKSNLTITPEALKRMQRYPWPGNVRELRNVVESMVLMAESDTLDVDDLPQDIRGSVNSKEIRLPVGVTMEEAERELIRRYLDYFPTKKQAAHALNIGLRTLHHKVKKFGLASAQPPAKRS